MNCITLIQLNTTQQKKKWPSLQLFISRWKNKTIIMLNDGEGMAPHSSTLAWKIPWMEEPGRLQSMGSRRVGHLLSDFTFTFHFHELEKEMTTHFSVLAWRIPGTAEPGGLPSVGSHRVGHNWSDLAAAVLNEQINLGLKVHTAISGRHSQKLSDGCCGSGKQM